MKKALLLLPLAALLLTGCEEPADEEDKKPSLNDISNAAVDSLANMYKAAVNGISLELKLSNANIHVVNEVVTTDTVSNITSRKKTDAEIKDFGFTLKLDARNLKGAIKDWEVAIVIEDLHGTDKIVMNETSVLADNVTYSDIDLGLYLKNNTLYANLSDPELKTCAKEVAGMVLGTSTEEIHKIEAMIDQYAKDLYIEDFADFIMGLMANDISSIPMEASTQRVLRASSGIEEIPLLPSELPADVITSLKAEFPEILGTVLGPTSPFSKAFNIALSNNLLSKIEVDFKSTDLPAETFEGNDITFDALLIANFNETGLLTDITTSETFDANVVNNTESSAIYDKTSGQLISNKVTNETTHFFGSLAPSLTVTYPTASILMPDFTGYEAFVMPE